MRKLTENNLKNLYYSTDEIISKDLLNKGKDPCWDGYEAIGTKEKNGKTVPNCVLKKGEEDESEEEKIEDEALAKSKAHEVLGLAEFSLETLEKGKKATVGEVREWSGKKYQKGADGWKEIKEGGKEASTPKKKVELETYHDSFTSASSNALEYAKSKGFEVNEDDWQTEVSLGGKYSRSRPSAGKTNSFSVGLIKDGKPQKKSLHFSVYGMESGRYELTAYVN